MTVELKFTGRKDSISKTKATTLLDELIDLHGSTNTSSGTYSVGHSNYVAERQSFVIEIALCDCDDGDFPTVKDDLANTVADLAVDFGTKSEIKEELSGSVA